METIELLYAAQVRALAMENRAKARNTLAGEARKEFEAINDLAPWIHKAHQELQAVAALIGSAPTRPDPTPAN